MLLDQRAGIGPKGSKIPALSVCREQSCSPKCHEVPGVHLPWGIPSSSTGLQCRCPPTLIRDSDPLLSGELGLSPECSGCRQSRCTWRDSGGCTRGDAGRSSAAARGATTSPCPPRSGTCHGKAVVSPGIPLREHCPSLKAELGGTRLPSLTCPSGWRGSAPHISSAGGGRAPTRTVQPMPLPPWPAAHPTPGRGKGKGGGGLAFWGEARGEIHSLCSEGHQGAAPVLLLGQLLPSCII